MFVKRLRLRRLDSLECRALKNRESFQNAFCLQEPFLTRVKLGMTSERRLALAVTVSDFIDMVSSDLCLPNWIVFNRFTVDLWLCMVSFWAFMFLFRDVPFVRTTLGFKCSYFIIATGFCSRADAFCSSGRIAKMCLSTMSSPRE